MFILLVTPQTFFGNHLGIAVIYFFFGTKTLGVSAAGHDALCPLLWHVSRCDICCRFSSVWPVLSGFCVYKVKRPGWVICLTSFTFNYIPDATDKPKTENSNQTALNANLQNRKLKTENRQATMSHMEQKKQNPKPQTQAAGRASKHRVSVSE